jgi:hypothetical protein
MINRKERIELTDSFLNVVVKLSEGNPGAANVCMMLMESAKMVNHQAAGDGILTLLALDTHGIYGSKIWMLYKDVCGQDIVTVHAVLRAIQLGIIPESKVLHAIDNRGEGLDVPSLLKAVMEKLDQFNK